MDPQVHRTKAGTHNGKEAEQRLSCHEGNSCQGEPSPLSSPVHNKTFIEGGNGKQLIPTLQDIYNQVGKTDQHIHVRVNLESRIARKTQYPLQVDREKQPQGFKLENKCYTDAM